MAESNVVTAQGRIINMSELPISAEELARLFHQYHRTLAPIFECEGSGTDVAWDEARPRERKLMIATARLVLSDLIQRSTKTESVSKSDEFPVRPYFAKPGQAEWGC
jgi:hypothetical protein